MSNRNARIHLPGQPPPGMQATPEVLLAGMVQLNAQLELILQVVTHNSDCAECGKRLQSVVRCGECATKTGEPPTATDLTPFEALDELKPGEPLAGDPEPPALCADCGRRLDGPEDGQAGLCRRCELRALSGLPRLKDVGLAAGPAQSSREP